MALIVFGKVIYDDTFGAGMALIVFGKVIYDDTFGVERFTEYALGWAGQYPPSQGVNMVFLEWGNRAS